MIDRQRKLTEASYSFPYITSESVFIYQLTYTRTSTSAHTLNVFLNKQNCGKSVNKIPEAENGRIHSDSLVRVQVRTAGHSTLTQEALRSPTEALEGLILHTSIPRHHGEVC